MNYNLKLPDWLYKLIRGHYPELPGVPIRKPDERATERNNLPDVLGDTGGTGNNIGGLINNLPINETDSETKQDEQKTTRTAVLEDNGDTSFNVINPLYFSQSTNLKTNYMNFFQKLGKLEHTVETWVRAAIIQANGVLNNVKAIEGSPTVQTLEQLLLPAVENVFPAAHIPAIIALVPKAFTIFNLVAAEAGKTDVQIVLDGLAALKAKGKIDPVAYAAILNGINAWLTVQSSALSGSPVPIQDALKSVPLVYESEKVAIAAEIVQPIHPVYTPLETPQQLTPVDQKAFDTVSVDKQGEKVNTFVNPATAPAI